MEYNAAVTEALGGFSTRVKTEKYVCVPFHCTLSICKCGEGNLSFPVPSSGIDGPL